MHRALWVGALCGLVCFGCSNGSGGNGSGANADDGGGGSSSGAMGGSSGVSSSGGGSTAKSLIGTWQVSLGPVGGSTGGAATMVTIGQDSLDVVSPDFTLTAVRTGNEVAYTDMAPGTIVLNAMQTAAPFDTGILPFNLGGTWAMQIVQGGVTVETCTLSVSASEVDGACHKITQGFDFSFTSTKMSAAGSVLGDFGGKWMNTFIDPSTGKTAPCELDFVGSGITTCTGGAVNGIPNGNPLSGITFTYDGANTASGAAQGWAEYSATRL